MGDNRLRAGRIARLHRLQLTAIAGGLLWVPYGIFEMLEPLGRDTAYDPERNYELVLDRGIYTLYSLPGALALLLTAVALAAGARSLPLSAGAAAGRVLGWLAVTLGLVSLVAAAVPFDPLFTGPRILGTLVLALATLAAATAVRGRARSYLVGLAASGVGSATLAARLRGQGHSGRCGRSGYRHLRARVGGSGRIARWGERRRLP